MVIILENDMRFNDWIGLIKGNLCYLIVAIMGLVLLAVGGVCHTTIGRVLFFVGLVLSILAIILGLRNKSVEWKEFD